MHDRRPNPIERLANRLLREGYVADEVEAYRLAVQILMATSGRRPARPDSGGVKENDDDPREGDRH